MPLFQKVQRTAEIPQVPLIDRILKDQFPTLQTVVETGEMPQTQHNDKVIDVPLSPISEQTAAVAKLFPQEQVQQRTVEQIVYVLVATHRQVPTMQQVQKTVKVLEVQYNDRIVSVPILWRRQVPVIATLW